MSRRVSASIYHQAALKPGRYGSPFSLMIPSSARSSRTWSRTKVAGTDWGAVG